jgi:hypothetical protein
MGAVSQALAGIINSATHRKGLGDAFDGCASLHGDKADILQPSREDQHVMRAAVAAVAPIDPLAFKALGGIVWHAERRR